MDTAMAATAAAPDQKAVQVLAVAERGEWQRWPGERPRSARRPPWVGGPTDSDGGGRELTFVRVYVPRWLTLGPCT